MRFTKDVYETNKNYLVVVEYEFVEGNKNDKASLYVNPTKSTTKPTLECLQDSTNAGGTQIGAIAKNDASKIASINLRQGTNTPRQVYVDEIKVATAWDDLFEDEENPPTGIGEVTGNGLQVTGQKILRNGQLIIVKDGKMFNVLGTAL